MRHFPLIYPQIGDFINQIPFLYFQVILIGHIQNVSLNLQNNKQYQTLVPVQNWNIPDPNRLKEILIGSKIEILNSK
jgi:hypothetical protein